MSGYADHGPSEASGSGDELSAVDEDFCVESGGWREEKEALHRADDNNADGVAKCPCSFVAVPEDLPAAGEKIPPTPLTSPTDWLFACLLTPRAASGEGDQANANGAVALAAHDPSLVLWPWRSTPNAAVKKRSPPVLLNL